MLTDGIDHVATITNDGDRLKEFYADVFGATVERAASQTYNEFWLELITRIEHACYNLIPQISSDAQCFVPSYLALPLPQAPILDNTQDRYNEADDGESGLDDVKQALQHFSLFPLRR